MNLIFLENFNNYFDRIVKSYTTISEYIKDRHYKVIQDVNFDEKNRIDTSHIVNWKENWIPNYMLAVEGETILSKWFVLEWDKLRGRQYNVTLKGDVIAMNLEQIKNSPIFVEKGMLKANDPFIFNNEGMTFNQIKKSEKLLKDKTGVGWLVGYYSQSEAKRDIVGSFSAIEGSDPIDDISTIKKFVKINFNNEENVTYANEKYLLSMYTWGKKQSRKNYHRKKYIEHFDNKEFLYQTGQLEPDGTNDYFFYSDFIDQETISDRLSSLFLNNAKSIIEVMRWKLTGRTGVEDDDLEYLLSLQNKFISVGEGNDKKIYKLDLKKLDGDVEVISGPGMDVYEEAKRIVQSDSLLRGVIFDLLYNSEEPRIRAIYQGYRYVVTATEIQKANEKVKVTLSETRNHLNDAPYDMFCAPYDLSNTTFLTVVTDTGEYSINNVLTIATIRSIMEQLGGTGANKFLFDVQYLPYCPIKELRESFDSNASRFDLRTINGFTITKDYDLLLRTSIDGKTEQPIGFIAWGNLSSGTFNISFDYKVPNNPVEMKVESETKLIRLCSPNYNGIFEFNPVKNNGIKFFNVDFTYKPFQPYIHINPNFNGLYGQDFNDNRGMIIGGDFSLPSISDNFINYQLNNKNYQEIFNREIKNMDVNNKLNVDSSLIAGGINAVTSGIGGAVAGGLMGGPVGAVVGGIAGGIGSMAGTGADLYFNQKAYRESKSFKTDMYNYALGNIKAQPQSISKTTPFTFNNKIFPFIEVYESTSEEKEALRLKIKYNGMTVMRIDELNKYLSKGDNKSFFKGQLVRVETLMDDYNMACAIYSELDKGVFM